MNFSRFFPKDWQKRNGTIVPLDIFLILLMDRNNICMFPWKWKKSNHSQVFLPSGDDDPLHLRKKFITLHSLSFFMQAGQRQIPVGGKKPKPALIAKTKENIPNKTGVGRRTRSQEKAQKTDVLEILDDSIDTSKDKTANSSSFDNISITSLLSEGEICKLSNDGLASSQEFTTSSRDTSTDKIVE